MAHFYYDDIKNIYFYTNSSEDGAQNEEKYDFLRKYLSILACESNTKSENFNNKIESVFCSKIAIPFNKQLSLS